MTREELAVQVASALGPARAAEAEGHLNRLDGEGEVFQAEYLRLLRGDATDVERDEHGRWITGGGASPKASPAAAPAKGGVDELSVPSDCSHNAIAKAAERSHLQVGGGGNHDTIRGQDGHVITQLPRHRHLNPNTCRGIVKCLRAAVASGDGGEPGLIREGMATMTREELTVELNAVAAPSAITGHLQRLDGESEDFQKTYLILLDGGADDVPRDEHGRWTGGGGGESTGEDANTSASHRAAHRFHDAKAREALHAWKPGQGDKTNRLAYKRHSEASSLHLQAASSMEKPGELVESPEVRAFQESHPGAVSIPTRRAQLASMQANGHMK